jgi:hypothetical protein
MAAAVKRFLVLDVRWCGLPVETFEVHHLAVVELLRDDAGDVICGAASCEVLAIAVFAVRVVDVTGEVLVDPNGAMR